MEGFNHKTANSKPYPNFTDVYKHLQPEAIFSYYIGGPFKTGSMCSPIGATDRHASFGLFYSRRYGKYMFKEHRYGYSGDAIDFVRCLFNYSDNRKACMRIVHDFGIGDFHVDKEISSLPGSIASPTKLYSDAVPPRDVEIRVTIRDWELYDLAYWKQFGITLEWLERGNIHPISHYYINGHMRYAHTYGYTYIEMKDDEITYKIYQPYADKRKKWISSNDASVWELWNLLPESFPIVIVTKSRKDALSIMSTLQIPSTSLQSEGTKPKPQVMQEIIDRFPRVVVLYDNDFDKETNYGLKYANSLSNEYGLETIMIPSEYQTKDYSDLVKKYGPEKASTILTTLLK